MAMSAALLAASCGDESRTAPPWNTKMRELAGWSGTADEIETWRAPPLPLGDSDLPVDVQLKKDQVAGSTEFRDTGGPRLAEAYPWRQSGEKMLEFSYRWTNI